MAPSPSHGLNRSDCQRIPALIGGFVGPPNHILIVSEDCVTADHVAPRKKNYEIRTRYFDGLTLVAVGLPLMQAVTLYRLADATLLEMMISSVEIALAAVSNSSTTVDVTYFVTT